MFEDLHINFRDGPRVLAAPLEQVMHITCQRDLLLVKLEATRSPSKVTMSTPFSCNLLDALGERTGAIAESLCDLRHFDLGKSGP